MEQFQIFDTYQKKSLLPSLGSSDEIYNKLKAAADDLVELLKKEPLKISKYLLVALDNTIAESEPILEEVENVIAAKWQMLRSHFENMPISLYRAIILEAISKLAVLNVKFASAIWLTAIDIYPLLNIPNKEEAVLKEFIDKLGDYVEESAIKDWKVNNEDVKVEIPKFAFTTVKSDAEVDEEQLKEEMIAASGPSGQDGVARKSPNPYWPNSNNNWSYQFAPRAATGIASVVNDALSDHTENINKNVESLQTALNTYFTDLGKNMKNALAEASKISVAVERRSQLLWWKETLYSKALHKSYRKLSPFESAIAMAHDLYYLLPSLFPVSVDYILRETYGQIYGAEKKEVKLIDFLTEVANEENSGFLGHYFKNNQVNNGRTDLPSYMRKLVFSKVDLKKDVVASLGIKPDTLVSYEEISLWILHSLSASYLLTPAK